MKTIKTALFSVIILLGVAMISDAFARGPRGHHGGGHHGGGHHGGGHHGGSYHGHSGVRLGVVFGVPPLWYYPSPYYYPSYPYPYYPPNVVVPAEPSVYIEQSQAAPAPSAPASAYWHYCAESGAYYPYVKECAGAWQRVAPLPPS